MDNVIDNWLDRSRYLLQEASTPWGIKASLGGKDNYNSIFTRDAVMAGIAGVLLEDDVIIKGLKNTLTNLKTLQGKQGQIASNYKVEAHKISHVSYGTLSPKIDACTWYMIGVGLMVKAGHIEKDVFQSSAALTIDLLDGLEYNGKHLMNIPKGGNWADEYIYDGYVLYDQVLRAWGLSILGEVYDNPVWSQKSKSILGVIQERYTNDSSLHYWSSISPGYTFEKFDLAAHALLGIVVERDNLDFNKAVDWISQYFIIDGKMPPVFYPLITELDAEWESLSKYYMFSFKNKPYHFHNGGIWWIWIGWFAIALSTSGRKTEMKRLIDAAFEYLDTQEEFDFEEYVSSDDMQLNGTKKLCYTATGVIFMGLAMKSFDFSILKSN